MEPVIQNPVEDQEFQDLKEAVNGGIQRIIDASKIPEIPFELSLQEYFQYSRALEQHHALFYKFWEMGRPQFTRRIPTACVCFDESGTFVEFLFNPNFWLSQTETQRSFTISHESLHVILDHGARMVGAIKTQNEFALRAANLAMDVVVNHMLVDQFNFDRTLVDPDNKFVWRDTLFAKHPDKHRILADQNFEYYYNLILKDIENKEQKGEGEGMSSYPTNGGLDSHEAIPQTAGDPLFREKLQRVIDSIEDDKRKELVKALGADLPKPKPGEKGKGQEEDGGLQAGSEEGGQIQIMPPTRRVYKKKWETIIRKWVLNSQHEDYHYEEVWLDVDRRTQGMMSSKNMYLPAEVERERPNKGRIDVYFFLDTSGSCSHLGPRFWKAALSLPPHRFKINCFCFDTKVYPVDLKKQELKGFGGTRFDIIESYIQNDIKTGKISKYPTGVFIITDGYGNSVTPEKPKHWHWFLTEQHDKSYIDTKSFHYLLNKFE